MNRIKQVKFLLFPSLIVLLAVFVQQVAGLYLWTKKYASMTSFASPVPISGVATNSYIVLDPQENFETTSTIYLTQIAYYPDLYQLSFGLVTPRFQSSLYRIEVKEPDGEESGTLLYSITQKYLHKKIIRIWLTLDEPLTLNKVYQVSIWSDDNLLCEKTVEFQRRNSDLIWVTS